MPGRPVVRRFDASVWADPNHPYWSARHGVWQITQTPLSSRYPCRCVREGRCRRDCPCSGRTDHMQMPALCCARRAAETLARQHQREEATRG